MTAEERRLQSQAAQAFVEWRLVSEGLTSYQQMGYCTPEGQPWDIKLHEFLAVDAEVQEALRDKAKQ